jgi:hypothetical protein
VKILITCPYSYNYRNIVYTGFLSELLENNYIVDLIVPVDLKDDKHLKEIQKKYDGKLRIIEFDFEIKKIFKFIFIIFSSWKYSLQKTKTYIKKKEVFKAQDWKSYIKFGLGSLLPRSNKLYRYLYKIFSTILFQCMKKDPNLRSDYDIALFTLAHKYDEIKYYSHALRCNALTINLVHSWDVITTKGFFPFDCDYSLFWSKRNLQEYEKYIDPFSFKKTEKFIVGAIQFDKYKNIPDVKCIDRNKRIVLLYTTSTSRLIPDEELFIKNLIESVRLKEKFYVLIRIHPQAKPSEFCSIPKSSKFHQIYRPEIPNLKLLDGVQFNKYSFDSIVNDIRSSDITISFASSMALDSMALNRPSIWLKNFNNPDVFYNNYYEYEHLLGAQKDLGIKVISDLDSLLNAIEQEIERTEEINPLDTFNQHYGEVGSSISSIMSIILNVKCS